MSYENYRPEWDPFFSESWGPPPELPPLNWGDRSADPKSSRRFNLEIPVFPVNREKILEGLK